MLTSSSFRLGEGQPLINASAHFLKEVTNSATLWRVTKIPNVDFLRF